MSNLANIYTALQNVATAITGLSGITIPGTMATQNADAVTITGGSLSGVTVAETAANALTATGTTRADALAIMAQINRFTTVASGTGCVITFTPGLVVDLFNDGAATLKVYAAGSTTIDGVAGATGVPLSTTKRCRYYCVAANVVVSAQLGSVSA